MKAISSVVSITIHVALGAAVLLGTAKTGRSDVRAPRAVRIVLPPAHNENLADGITGLPIPGPISVGAPDLGRIPIPSLPQTGATTPPFATTSSGLADPSGAGSTTGWNSFLGEEPAEILTGPLPSYPELLRQAGVQGKVVLEAVVDTTGRVLAQSLLVVAATNPGFVEPARQALLATLFRPANSGGKPVRMRVRIPYQFSIRDGMGRAR